MSLNCKLTFIFFEAKTFINIIILTKRKKKYINFFITYIYEGTLFRALNYKFISRFIRTFKLASTAIAILFNDNIFIKISIKSLIEYNVTDVRKVYGQKYQYPYRKPAI